MEIPELPKETEVTVYWYWHAGIRRLWPSCFECTAPDAVYLGEETLTLAVPQVDVREKQIKALEQQLEDTRADYQNRVTEIERQISELKALEWSGNE